MLGIGVVRIVVKGSKGSIIDGNGSSKSPGIGDNDGVYNQPKTEVVWQSDWGKGKYYYYWG